ncbi:MAG: hypothetical protein QNJ31_06830 [Candidatus Caenarcaniphilales bacterium]|nr:hypothetical protein [Candidatus Caenarcaniphilales bacterium]
MIKKLPILILCSLFAVLIISIVSSVLPSIAGCGGNCGGNMCIAPWGPSNYRERPIYPMRGCTNGACQKGWRSAIIYPPPSRPYGGQVHASPPVGCAPMLPCNSCASWR